MEMTHRERLINAMRGRETDRLPWSPFLAYYFEHLPQPVQDRGQLPYLLEMGADPLLRGFVQLFDTTFDGCTMNGGSPVYYVDNTDGIIRGGNVPNVTVK